MHPASATRMPKFKLNPISNDRCANMIQGLTRDRIKRPHFIHTAQAQYEFFPQRHAPTNKSSVASLRDNPNTALMTMLHNFADFLGRARSQHGRRLSMILVHPIIIVLRELGRGRRDGRERRKNG